MRHTLPLLLCALALTPAAAQDGGRLLASGQTVSGRLPDGDRVYQSYRIQVPAGSTRLVVQAVGKGDVDLYLRAGAPIESSWEDEAHAKANSEAQTETITLTPDGTPALRATTYYIDAVNATQTAFSYTLTATVERGDGPGATPLAEGELGPKRGGSPPRIDADREEPFELATDGTNFRTFLLEVAPDVARVTLTTRGARQDVDLYVRFGEAMSDWAQAEHTAATPSPDEELVLAREAGVPRLRTGVYYVDVARASDEATPVTLTVRFERGYTGPEAPAGSLEPSRESGVEGEVTSDAVFSATLDGQTAYRTYAIVVPKQANSMLITVAGAEQDVDLYLRHGAQIEDYTADPDHRANGSRRDEQLYVDRSSDPPLRPGRYYLDVTRAAEGSAGTVEITVRFDAERPPPQPATSGPVVPLSLGQRLEVNLKRSEHKAGRYSFRVPEGARSLHVAALRATRDVDLFLRREAPITSYDAADGYDHKAVTALLAERLVVTRESDPPLRPGEYFLDVASLIDSDELVDFTLIVTVDAPPAYEPDDLPLPPYRREPGNPLEQAVRATVQIASSAGEGSGTCLTPSGLIVTNFHVIADDEGHPVEEPLFVSFVDRLDLPPRQCFQAEIVETDEEHDLALLRLTKDVLDRPLPKDLRLPWLALGDPTTLHLGDPLLVAGYPAVGGPEGRTSLTLTRGIVSGFTTTRGARNWIKTDARINAGNSGGTALGPDLRLVGIPTLEQVEGDDELGYCRSVERLPTAWQDMVRAGVERR